MAGFTDRLKKGRDLKPSDISLRGTGITKRILEKTDRAYEREVAKSIKSGQSEAAQEAAQKFQSGIDATMASIAADIAKKNIQLDPSQLKALHGILRNKVSCLIGAAGTGKTTLERIIIEQLSKRVNVVRLSQEEIDKLRETDPDFEPEDNETLGIAVAAYTGRASQQSRKAIGADLNIPISTMHSLLGYAPVMIEVDAYDEISRTYYKKEKRAFRPSFNASIKLPYTVYIIDESSMMPIPLWNEFIDAIHKTSRILLVGDIHQLPPVYGKSVLGYALKHWPTFELETIHRQAAGNAIIANSQRILRGQMLQKASNFHLIQSQAAGSMEFSLFIRQVTQKLAAKNLFDPYRDVVIVANSDEEIATSAPALNEYFMTMFNAEKTVDGVIINKRIHIHTGTGDAFFAVGDKVMINQNINTINPPITNGMMGVVESVNLNGKYDMKRAQIDTGAAVESISFDQLSVAFKLEADKDDKKEEKDDETLDQRQASHVMTIKFETGQTFHASTAGDYRKISFGYAITCHKSQGGEYPNIIIAIHSANGALLTQEWLYTAVTRARNNVFLLFNDRGLQRALKNQKIKGKNLQEKIKSYIIETNSDDEGAADDPWNVDVKKYPILFKPEIVEK